MLLVKRTLLPLRKSKWSCDTDILGIFCKFKLVSELILSVLIYHELLFYGLYLVYVRDIQCVSAVKVISQKFCQGYFHLSYIYLRFKITRLGELHLTGARGLILFFVEVYFEKSLGFGGRL